MRPLDAVEQIEAIELRALQPNVEDDERGAPLLDGRQRLVAILGEPGAMPLVLKDAGNQLSDIGFVVDDEDVRRHGLLLLSSFRRRGSLRLKRGALPICLGAGKDLIHLPDGQVHAHRCALYFAVALRRIGKL